MSRSATSSDPGAKAARAAAVALVLLVAVFAAALPAAAKVFLTVDEALRLAFPDCEVTRGTVYLTEAQRVRAAELVGEEVPSAVVHPYAARRDGALVGTAYFDTHRVRTLPETVMVVADPEGKVMRVEVLSFNEPENYLARRSWYEQFRGRPLDGELALKRGLRGLTGATLTARATAAAVRRVLAVHATLAAAAAATSDAAAGAAAGAEAGAAAGAEKGAAAGAPAGDERR